MYKILAFISVSSFVAYLVTDMPEFNVVANVTIVLAIVTFITKMANLEQLEQKPEIKRCPPHAWNYNEAGVMFCKACGKRPLAE